ncbi:hypothetical protein KC957_01650 [Candidatus Saccharibacteria bacterium]|nr:hypothetical protein [Candidatus Saccharibacteria bacterium]
MVQKAYKGKNPNRHVGRQRPGDVRRIETDELASRLGFSGTQGSSTDRADRYGMSSAESTPHQVSSDTGKYIGRYVVGSRAIVRGLVRQFPGLTPYHANERMVLPLVSAPTNAMGQRHVSGALKQATRARSELRFNMANVAVDDQLTWSPLSNGLYGLGLSLPISSRRWPTEIEDDCAAVSRALNIRRALLPEHILIATAPDEASVREAADYDANEARYFASGLVELTSAQVCPVPIVDVTSGNG